MRISDWSSDVCSSDLIRRSGDLECHTAGADRQAEREEGAALLLRLGEPSHLAQRRRLPERQPKPARHRFAPLDLAEQRLPLSDPLLHVAPVERARDRPHRLRSEEHTSELQSLMRISYAVFCLKKKKAHNKTQRQH